MDRSSRMDGTSFETDSNRAERGTGTGKGRGRGWAGSGKSGDGTGGREDGNDRWIQRCRNGPERRDGREKIGMDMCHGTGTTYQQENQKGATLKRVIVERTRRTN